MRWQPDPPRTPIVIERAFADPGRVRRLAKRLGPYRPVQRYFSTHAQMKAVEVHSTAEPRVGPGTDQRVQPWFRQDWAFGAALFEGVDALLEHAPFIDAARALFGRERVEFHSLYANLVTPSRGVDAGHLDIPAFRGMHRHTHPPWLLAAMLRSGLFERWHVPVVTCVSWFYEGDGGGFSYWPDGTSGDVVNRPCVNNSAIAADLDHMFHRVRSVAPGSAEAPLTLDVDSSLRWANDGWRVRTNGREVARFADESVRLSLTWKAIAHANERARVVHHGHADDLDLERVLEVFAGALAWPELAEGDPALRVAEPAVVARLSARFAPRAPSTG